MVFLLRSVRLIIRLRNTALIIHKLINPNPFCDMADAFSTHCAVELQVLLNHKIIGNSSLN
jgi:hypothetical protein